MHATMHTLKVELKRQGLQGFRLYAMYIGNSEKMKILIYSIYGGSIPN